MVGGLAPPASMERTLNISRLGKKTPHKSGAAEAGEVARNQAPPHRLDWPINAMFILGIRKSKIKQNGYYLFFHFLLLNISHNAGKTLLLTHF